jgi:hypothetical protein
MSSAKKVYIAIMFNGDDSGSIVQYAHSIEQAKMLIEKVLPPLQSGYYYKIINQ